MKNLILCVFSIILYTGCSTKGVNNQNEPSYFFENCLMEKSNQKQFQGGCIFEKQQIKLLMFLRKIKKTIAKQTLKILK